MKIDFSESAVKFLAKIDNRNRERIRIRIRDLYIYLNEFGILPFTGMDIKNLKVSGKDVID